MDGWIFIYIWLAGEWSVPSWLKQGLLGSFCLFFYLRTLCGMCLMKPARVLILKCSWHQSVNIFSHIWLVCECSNPISYQQPRHVNNTWRNAEKLTSRGFSEKRWKWHLAVALQLVTNCWWRVQFLVLWHLCIKWWYFHCWKLWGCIQNYSTCIT